MQKKKFLHYFEFVESHFSTLRGPGGNVNKLVRMTSLKPKEDTDMDLGAIHMKVINETMGVSGK